MSQKISCEICDKRCRKKQKYQQCCKCKKFIHQRCTNLSPLQFSCFSGPQGQNPLVCDLCTVQSPTSIISHRVKNAANGKQGGNWDAYKNLNFINNKLKAGDDLFILHINIVVLHSHLSFLKSGVQ